MSETRNAYQWAKETLGSRDRKKLERNTYLERRGPQRFAVVLHETDIVTITPSYVELDTGGWHTMTTRSRMDSYSPVDVATWPRGWNIYLKAEQDCYCHEDQFSGGDGIVVEGIWRVGKRLAFKDEYELPSGQRVSARLHEQGAKPVYHFVTCHICNGTGRRIGVDWSSEGYPYFDGIRVSTDGRRLLKNQPNRPKHFKKVVTQSGFTGRTRAGWGYALGR